MLYRTVYGSELEALYTWIASGPSEGVKRQQIYTAFISGYSEPSGASTQNIDDALHFLASAHLLNEHKGKWQLSSNRSASLAGRPLSFRHRLLQHLRQIQLGHLACRHPSDSTYLLLLEKLYVQPRQQFVEQLHIQANQLEAVQDIGGLSREKLQAWCRVMNYLGLGIRHQGSFVFVPEPSLLLELFFSYGKSEGILQEIIDTHLTTILPCCDLGGELTSSIETTLSMLQQQHKLEFFPLQDSPSRPYFGSARYRAFQVL